MNSPFDFNLDVLALDNFVETSYNDITSKNVVSSTVGARITNTIIIIYNRAGCFHLYIITSSTCK